MLYIEGTYLVIPVKTGRRFNLKLRPVKLKKSEERKLRKIENINARDIFAIAKISKVVYRNGEFFIL